MISINEDMDYRHSRTPRGQYKLYQSSFSFFSPLIVCKNTYLQTSHELGMYLELNT